MTVNRGMFVRALGAVGTTPIEARLALAGMLAHNAPGVPRSGLLDQSTALPVTGTGSMTYSIAPLTAVINRAANEGVYVVTLTGTTTVPTLAAPSSGSRYDLVYVKQNDPDKGDVIDGTTTPLNTAVVGVVQGDASTSPVRPTSKLPAGAYVLAEALIGANSASTSAASVSIAQLWRYTTSAGGAIPVRSTAERDEITAAEGVRVRRLDVGWIELYTAVGVRTPGYFPVDGAMPRARGVRTTAQTINNVGTALVSVNFGLDAVNTNSVVMNGSSIFTAPVSGRYSITGCVYWSGNSSGYRAVGILTTGAGAVSGVWSLQALGINSGMYQNFARELYVEAGASISVQVGQNTGSDLTILPAGTEVTISYLGPA